MSSDQKPSRIVSQHPQDVNAVGNKPSESQAPGTPAASPHIPGDAQQGTTGAPNTPTDTSIGDPVNPSGTKPSTTAYTSENAAYSTAQPSPQAQEATDQTRSTPPPTRR